MPRSLNPVGFWTAWKLRRLKTLRLVALNHSIRTSSELSRYTLVPSRLQRFAPRTRRRRAFRRGAETRLLRTPHRLSICLLEGWAQRPLLHRRAELYRAPRRYRRMSFDRRRIGVE